MAVSRNVLVVKKTQEIQYPEKETTTRWDLTVRK